MMSLDQTIAEAQECRRQTEITKNTAQKLLFEKLAARYRKLADINIWFRNRRNIHPDTDRRLQTLTSLK